MQWKIILICAAGWGADMPMSGFYEVFLPGLRPPASGLSRTLRRTLRPSALRSDIRLLISFVITFSYGSVVVVIAVIGLVVGADFSSTLPPSFLKASEAI